MRFRPPTFKLRREPPENYSQTGVLVQTTCQQVAHLQELLLT
jgi:hypothetical protein